MGLLNIFSSKENNHHKSTEPMDNRKAECPNCGKELNKIPSRKTKCPNCGKFMFVRTSPKNRERIIVTEEQAAAIDNEWLMQQAADNSSLGGEEEFYKEKEILKKRFGKEPSVSDIKWGLLNKRAGEAMKKSDFQTLSGIYFQMALQKHEEGMDCHTEQAQAQKMELMALKENGVVSQVEILSKDGCDECKKFNEKKFSIKEALESNPLPVSACTHKLNKKASGSWCRCTYLPVVN